MRATRTSPVGATAAAAAGPELTRIAVYRLERASPQAAAAGPRTLCLELLQLLEEIPRHGRRGGVGSAAAGDVDGERITRPLSRRVTDDDRLIAVPLAAGSLCAEITD